MIATQVDGCGRRVNRPAKSLLHQAGNPAAVIEVGVGEDDGIDIARRHGRVLPVALTPFFLSLKHSAVDQGLKPVAPRPNPKRY